MPEPLLLHLLRYRFGADATLGRLSVGPDFFGYVCEDEDRGLAQTMTDERIAAIKVRSETAIPIGSYEILDTYSPKYRRDMLLLNGVPGFAGIRIHSGNHEGHTAGCLLPGEGVDEANYRVTDSRVATKKLESIIRAAMSEGRRVYIAITRDAVAWEERQT